MYINLAKILKCLALITNLHICEFRTLGNFIQAIWLAVCFLQTICGLVLISRFQNKITIIFYLILKSIFTGLIHEDALADLIDTSLLQNINMKFKLLKFPTLGVYGCNILIFTFMLEYFILNEFDKFLLPKVCMISVLISYFYMLWHWNTMEHAYDNSFYVPKSVNVIIWMILIMIITWYAFGLKSVFIIYIQNFLILYLYNICILHKFGGCTGDSLGYIKRVIEINSMFSLTYLI